MSVKIKFSKRRDIPRAVAIVEPKCCVEQYSLFLDSLYKLVGLDKAKWLRVVDEHDRNIVVVPPTDE